MILLTVIFSACILTITASEKLHEHMTKEEIERIFNVRHDEVHKVEYDVVPIYHKNNGQTNVKLRAFDQNYDLYLEKNDHILLGENTPVYVANGNRGRSFNGDKITYSRIPYPFPNYLGLYHDVKNRAALAVHKDSNNKSHFDGIIGNNMIIRHVPARFHDGAFKNFTRLAKNTSNDYEYNIFDSFFSNSSAYSNYEPTHHVVIKSHMNINGFNDIEDTESIFEQLKNELEAKMNQQTGKPFANWRPTNKPSDWRSKTREPFYWHPKTNEPFYWHPKTKKPFYWRPKSTYAPPHLQSQTSVPPTNQYPINRPQIFDENNMIYPELLITVDYDTFKFHGSDVQTVAKYVAAFWNAVDLRYRELSNPKVRLNIAGLIMPQELKGASYFETHHATSKTLFAEDTLKTIGRYFAKSEQFPKNKYDIVVGMTHRNLGEIMKGKLRDSISGIAASAGACAVENGLSAVLVRDKGGFNGVTTAAHELAHSMGAPHDGNESRNIPGGPCPSSDGYLMSYQRKTSRGVHWSRCSITAMKNFFRQRQAQCLKNKPNPGKPYPKILPGRLLTREEQCQRNLGRKADQRAINDCALLWCEGMTESRPPAEGTSCGHEMICLDAVCVRDPELSS